MNLNGTYTDLYAHATEDLASYLPALEPEGARCLTVASSGDHAVNLLAAGAREVVAFDCEPVAAHVARLKLATLLALPRGEFVSSMSIREQL